jgi:hypothetical protein
LEVPHIEAGVPVARPMTLAMRAQDALDWMAALPPMVLRGRSENRAFHLPSDADRSWVPCRNPAHSLDFYLS